MLVLLLLLLPPAAVPLPKLVILLPSVLLLLVPLAREVVCEASTTTNVRAHLHIRLISALFVLYLPFPFLFNHRPGCREILDILLGDERYTEMGAHPVRVRVLGLVFQRALPAYPKQTPPDCLAHPALLVSCGSGRAPASLPLCMYCPQPVLPPPAACFPTPPLPSRHMGSHPCPCCSPFPGCPAGGAAGHRQDAAGQGDGGGGGDPLLLGQRRGVRGDVPGRRRFVASLLVVVGCWG